MKRLRHDLNYTISAVLLGVNGIEEAAIYMLAVGKT